MGVPIHLKKEEETDRHCTYSFGPADADVGRITLDKQSGDIEIDQLQAADAAPNVRYCLAQVVPRLHSFHERGDYPDSDELRA